MSNVDANLHLLDELLEEAKLYTSSASYFELLEFISNQREIAPFNAMLLQIQKPGLSYAAYRKDWLSKYNRRPKKGARPLIILMPFAPVALVYDVQDTEGDPLPEDVFSFPAYGEVDNRWFLESKNRLMRLGIRTISFDGGDNSAGSIQALANQNGKKLAYELMINQNHSLPSQFCTLSHELGHLYLGHLGKNSELSIPDRRGLGHAKEELEAESVAYIMCKKNNIHPRSQTYLKNFVDDAITANDMEIYQITRAASAVERIYKHTVRIATSGTLDQVSIQSELDLGYGF